jgi:antitoxin ParD1/3/4
MAHTEKISITLPEELLKSINEAVESGQYSSTSEVIGDALRGWQFRQPLREAEIERLRKAWEEGLASGAPSAYDLDEILSGPKRRLKELQRKRA